MVHYSKDVLEPSSFPPSPFIASTTTTNTTFKLVRCIVVPILVLLAVVAVNLGRTWQMVGLGSSVAGAASTATPVKTTTKLHTASIDDAVSTEKLASLKVNPSSPQVVWLLSFPNSGTTYTLQYIQGITQTTTATNYGACEQVGYETSIAVHLNETSGPFFRHPEQAVPTHSILTKTHCEAHRVDIDVNDFITACRTGKQSMRYKNGTVTTQSAVYALPHAAVHLIRHPVDNAVARMHYEQKRLAAKTKTATTAANRIDSKSRINNATTASAKTSSTEDDWNEWCRAMDQTTVQRYSKRLNMTNADSIWNTHQLQDIPCALEFYRYFLWHQYAYETTRRMETSMILYYENYTINHEATVIELLSFLHFDASALLQKAHANNDSPSHAHSATTGTTGPPDFIPGKTYPHMLTKSQLAKVKRLGRALVTSPGAWALLRDYF